MKGYSGFDIQNAIVYSDANNDRKAELMIMYNIMLELMHISSKLDGLNDKEDK